jgi:uncharacterized protein
VYFLLHSPSGFPAWPLASTLSFGVRTFLATARAARLPSLLLQHIAVRHSHDAEVTRPHPTLRGGVGTRFPALIAALLLYGWGELLTVRADVGLGPWDVLHQAVAIHSGLRFGVAVVVVSFVVLVLAAALGERPGIATVLNALIVGSSFDLFDRLNLAPHLHGGAGGLALDVAGIAVIGLASALYIGAAFGAGPRDSLMLAIVRRGPRIAVASWAIQIGALSLGFAFGGSVGVGTVLFAVGLGPCMEGAYWVLRRLGITRPASQAAAPGANPAVGLT